MLIFCSQPVMSVTYKNRKDLKLIKILPAGTYGSLSLKTELTAVYPYITFPLPAASNFNVLLCYAMVNDVSFNPSVFALCIGSFVHV